MKKLLIFQLSIMCCGQLVNAQTDELIGVASIGGKTNGGVIFKINSDGTGFDTLYSFNKIKPTTGYEPMDRLVQGDNGKWYGILSNTPINADSGAVFSFDLTTHICKRLLAFNGQNGIPIYGTVTPARNGNLYITTSSDSCGTILCYNPADDTYTKALNFNTTDGKYPFGGLTRAKDGKLYGMTAYGGAFNDGELFSFDPATNSYKKLFDFNRKNGYRPWGRLTEARNGKLYGMTSGGGMNDTGMWNYGDGVLFCFDPANNTYTKLFDFKWDSGATPQGSLLQAKNGKLYGMTWYGGANKIGVVFMFDPSDNTYTDLHNFNDTDGSYPQGSFIQAKNNMLYGMSSRGGAHNFGVIFTIDTSNNTYKKIYDFDRVKGALPLGDLSEVR
jgi:uncharacterized repeat protein (TIGR03803 family)